MPLNAMNSNNEENSAEHRIPMQSELTSIHQSNVGNKSLALKVLVLLMLSGSTILLCHLLQRMMAADAAKLMLAAGSQGRRRPRPARDGKWQVHH